VIEKLFNHPYLLHQTADSDVDMADATIGACIDNRGTICLSQEGESPALQTLVDIW